MEQAASGFLKIILFLLLGFVFRKKAVLNDQGMEGIKKIVLFLAIPSILFLSFSRLKFNFSFFPVTAIVFSINFILFRLGVMIVRVKGDKYRILPLCLSTMNFALLGIPLYESVYGIENLHNYTLFGVGNEIYTWFVFYFMFRSFLSKGNAKSSEWKSFFKTPVIWGLFLGCLAGLLNYDISSSGNVLVSGISELINAASKLTTPLILIFIGYNISLTPRYTKGSLKYAALRLFFMYALGYLLKILVMDRFLEPSFSTDTAYFLLLSLPPVFSLPILADEYLEKEELILLNNIIVLHALITIVLFAVFSFIKM